MVQTTVWYACLGQVAVKDGSGSCRARALKRWRIVLGVIAFRRTSTALHLPYYGHFAGNAVYGRFPGRATTSRAFCARDA